MNLFQNFWSKIFLCWDLLEYYSVEISFNEINKISLVMQIKSLRCFKWQIYDSSLKIKKILSSFRKKIIFKVKSLLLFSIFLEIIKLINRQSISKEHKNWKFHSTGIWTKRCSKKEIKEKVKETKSQLLQNFTTYKFQSSSYSYPTLFP